MAFPKELAARLNAIDPNDNFAAGRAERLRLEQQFEAARAFRARAERIFDRTMILGCTALALAGGLITGDQARPAQPECPPGMTAVDVDAMAHQQALIDALNGEAPLELPDGPQTVGSLNWAQQSEPVPDHFECAYVA